MSAGKEKSLTPPIEKLGIIAGGGVIPAKLVKACADQNIYPVVVGLRGHTQSVAPDYWGRIGSAGKIIRFYKRQNIHDIVLIGSVKRPGIFDLWPDWITLKFFLKAWLKSFGDNDLLKSARQELEKMGFHLHGVHKFLPDLLMPEGLIAGTLPTPSQQKDIQIGLQASQDLGRQDIGQAVIVKEGKIIGREDKKGTSALIKRHGVQGALLVKTCKPQQDKDLDLPTIGPKTVELCRDKKMAGIIGQAQNTLLVEREQVKSLANQAGLFVVGGTLHE